jgi:hypothetical protein
MNLTHKPGNTATNTSAPADITPADLLRAAALYLKRHGWLQGSYYGRDDDTSDVSDPFPHACLGGAIAMAICGRLTYADERTPDEQRLYNTMTGIVTGWLQRSGPGYFTNTDPACWDSWDCDPELYGWNDSPGRTISQVTDMLTDAADDWDRTHTTDGGAR